MASFLYKLFVFQQCYNAFLTVLLLSLLSLFHVNIEVLLLLS